MICQKVPNLFPFDIVLRNSRQGMGDSLQHRISLCAVSVLAAASFAHAGPVSGDYPHYNGDAGGMHYSPLTQINAKNVGRLKEAWRYDLKRDGELENTPIMVGGVLYAVGAAKVIALDAATGAEKWVFAPELPQKSRDGFNDRGESWWTDGKTSRLLVTASNFVYSLDPATGQPDPGFGEKGRIDLNDNLRGPASANYVRMGGAVNVYGDMFFTCGEVGEQTPASPGDIRAWDVRTGKLVWTFHTIPHPGERNAETWAAGAWQTAGGANDWPGMVLDEKRGILFAGTGSASDDFYGGERPGKNLYANSLIALDVKTGKMLWYFQAVHHDEWDNDFASPPVLVTVTRKGRKIAAVAATNKTGYVYVFNRETGESLFPIDEVPVPPATAPGDTAWPTQPRPRLPPPLSHQTITAEELTQRTPEANAWARTKFATFLNGPTFTPPAYNQETVSLPGFSGGNEWGGMSFDPRLEYLFVNTENVLWTTAVIDRKGRTRVEGPELAGSQSHFTFSGYNKFKDPEGYPATAAPWGHLTAINLKTGQFAWRIPFGEYPELVAKGMKDTGSESYGGAVATASGLLVIGATDFDRKLHAFDSRTGKLLWDTVLPYAGNATPISYMAQGKQYIVIGAGTGHDKKAAKGSAYVAYALGD
jgi:quinoprotein glucose dehydrogenase